MHVCVRTVKLAYSPDAATWLHHRYECRTNSSNAGTCCLLPIDLLPPYLATVAPVQSGPSISPGSAIEPDDLASDMGFPDMLISDVTCACLFW